MVNPSPTLVTFAQAAQKAWHIPASVSLGQCCLESSWATRMPKGSLNPFGIKARVRNGVIIDPYVMAGTDEEYQPGKIWHGPQPFRKFADLGAAFDYHAKLLATASAYAPAVAKLPNVYEFIRVMGPVYATDEEYADKLIGVIHSGNLTQYDTGAK